MYIILLGHNYPNIWRKNGMANWVVRENDKIRRKKYEHLAVGCFIFVSLDSHHVNFIIMFVPFLILDLLVWYRSLVIFWTHEVIKWTGSCDKLNIMINTMLQLSDLINTIISCFMDSLLINGQFRDIIIDRLLYSGLVEVSCCNDNFCFN